jgi:hypothetical protein
MKILLVFLFIAYLPSILSFGALAVQIILLVLNARSKRWRLVITPVPGTSTDTPHNFIIMQSFNSGERTIALKAVWINFRIPKGNIFRRRILKHAPNELLPKSWYRGYTVFMDNFFVDIPTFPIVLDPGRSRDIKLNGDNILLNLKANIKIRNFKKPPTTIEIRGIFESETIKHYISKKVMIDLETGQIS